MSLKANELRVGNYVKGIGHKISWLVDGIEGDFIYSSKAWRLLNCFEGIPINKEWLLKLGFIQQGVIINNNGLTEQCGINYFIRNNIVYSLSDNQVELDNPNVFLCNLKYVHQLQNLYFALTGQELTYNC